MPQNSVTVYVKNLLQGLESPQLPPLNVVISDPVWADIAAAPIAYIWAARGELFERQTAPRPIAWQKWKWTLTCSMLTVMDRDDPTISSAFPLLIDQVNAAVATTPIVAVIQDPVTGFQSQVLAIGEHSQHEYARLKATGSGGEELVRLGVDLQIELIESISYFYSTYYNPTPAP